MKGDVRMMEMHQEGDFSTAPATVVHTNPFHSVHRCSKVPEIVRQNVLCSCSVSSNGF